MEKEIIILNSSKKRNLDPKKRIARKQQLDIQNLPESYDIDHTKSFNKKIKRIDENYYSLDFADLIFNIYIGLGLLLLSFILNIFLDTEGFSLFFYSMPGLIGVFHIGYNYLNRNNKKFIMDRINGIMSYPDFLFKKPIITDFNNVVASIRGTGNYGAMVLKFKHSIFLTYFSLNNYAPLKFWSFMVWYMDKNRPLPPGTAFDPYRQKDFERRKAAGFPPPLYYSCGIHTPEATPEQQAEREQYWKDQEYFAPQIDRPKHSEIFNTRTHTDWVLSRFEADGHLMANTWHEFTFDNGIIVYMLTDENGEGYLPPKDQNVKVASLKLKERWY